MKLLGRRAECEFLDAALADAQDGRSRVVVLRGEAGSGKSALLDYLHGQSDGWRVATALGVESEAELDYSGLHQLCAPLLDHLERLPTPQRSALATVFGQETGAAPDRFLVALAALTLLAEAAEHQPLLCVIDDAQWLDDASAQILLFVGRRLLAERIAFVCAARTEIGSEVLGGLPELLLTGLGDRDARALLLENMQGPFDTAICDQIVNESHGNPLALLELPRTWNGAELAGGFGLPARHPVVGRIEQSYATRVRLLPAETQLLVLAAAAEPLGDPGLLQRACAILGIEMAASGPAVEAGLMQVWGRIEFAHPLVRSAAYGTATDDDRQRVHRALADATDSETGADRRAWHRARGSPRPDEDVAAELESSAGRAQARGGVAAAAAFLERAATLSPEPRARARRSLAAAEAKQLAGAPQVASRLLAIAAGGPLGELDVARAERLRGLIALDLRRGGEAVPYLLDAAHRFESLAPATAREAYLDALYAASIGGRLAGDLLRRAAEAAGKAPSPSAAPGAEDVLLVGLAIRFTDGYAASAAALKRALAAFRDEDPRSVHDARWPGFARRIAPDLFDDEAWHTLITRGVQLARDRGALGVLPIALNNLGLVRMFEGDLDAATAFVEESDAIVELTGAGRIAFARPTLAAFRGDERAVAREIEAGETLALVRGDGATLTVGEHARAVLYNGLGQYEAALAAAESASAWDEPPASLWSLHELIEAASRCGSRDAAALGLERLVERTQAAGTEWALGIEARCRALVTDGPPAEALYRQAIDRLARCRIAVELARSHLLYGEWLRRSGRRVDARDELRTAHDMLSTFGMEAFAERAQRELIATGERARRRRDETRSELTPQEAQIAQLAREGYSNPEIGAQLFLSPRTVEWHMRKVFGKLDITSRRQLDTALGGRAPRTA